MLVNLKTQYYSNGYTCTLKQTIIIFKVNYGIMNVVVASIFIGGLKSSTVTFAPIRTTLHIMDRYINTDLTCECQAGIPRYNIG